MRLIFLNLAGLAVIVAFALVQGQWSHRWRPFDRAAVTASIDRVPMQLGDWIGADGSDEDITTYRDEMDLGIIRRYTHRVTGESLLLMIRGGPPGPIGLHHTPASCYHAVGFMDLGSDVKRSVPDVGNGPNVFWVSAFEKPGAAKNRVRIYWGYSGGAGWTAPVNTRLELAAFDVCQKLYVVRNLTDPNDPLEGDYCEKFLREALPAIDAALFQDSRGRDSRADSNQ